MKMTFMIIQMILPKMLSRKLAHQKTHVRRRELNSVQNEPGNLLTDVMTSENPGGNNMMTETSRERMILMTHLKVLSTSVSK